MAGHCHTAVFQRLFPSLSEKGNVVVGKHREKYLSKNILPYTSNILTRSLMDSRNVMVNIFMFTMISVIFYKKKNIY